MDQLEAANKSLVAIKSALKESSNQTVDYIGKVNASIHKKQPISEIRDPELKNL